MDMKEDRSSAIASFGLKERDSSAWKNNKCVSERMKWTKDGNIQSWMVYPNLNVPIQPGSYSLLQHEEPGTMSTLSTTQQPKDTRKSYSLPDLERGATPLTLKVTPTAPRIQPHPAERPVPKRRYATK
jgi:hypothetical protein